MQIRFALTLFLSNVIIGMAQPAYDCKKITTFKQLLTSHHVSPAVWDDRFFENVTEQIFKLIDPQALYLSKDELNLFTANAKKANTNLLNCNCTFIAQLTPLYKKSLDRAERFIHEVRNIPLDFLVNDTLTYDVWGSNFLTTDKALRNRWIQWAKLAVLKELETRESDPKIIASNAKIIADKTYNKYLNVIKRKKEVAGGIENFLFNKLLNAIATVYDPHTEFFPASDKQSFLDMLSADNYSFGFILEDDRMGNAVIARIIPGSSAWEMKNIHIGDLVTAISSPHMERIDASLYTSEELEDILEKISKEVELSVQKIGGEQVTVKLIKQKVREDNNKIKSVIISNTKSRFGYVSLPTFFSKDEITKTGCATELAKEIIHLKSAKIQGLIIDLRNNGGGSLTEAIDLAGMFIDRGALAIVKNNNEEPETLKDTNLGTAYDGPLLIMINGGSASASELFAASMRDHNRAILLGSATYGKATGQTVMFFDATQRDMLKVTSFRFYNIKGTSHQGQGITPDISLPDMIDEGAYNESNQAYALPADRILKKTYYTPLPPLPLDLLRDSSNQRTNKNLFFKDVELRKQKITPYRREGKFKVPLSMAGFLEMDSRLRNEMQSSTPVSDQWIIKLTSFDEQVTGIDNFGQDTFNNLIEGVSHDFYIAEALHILTNYIQLKK